MEKEEEEKKAQLELSNKINNTLTECLQLIKVSENDNLPKLCQVLLRFLNTFLKYSFGRQPLSKQKFSYSFE